jgi:hypothetical protein
MGGDRRSWRLIVIVAVLPSGAQARPRLVQNVLANARVVRVHLDDLVAHVHGLDVPLGLEVLERELVAGGGGGLAVEVPRLVVVVGGVAVGLGGVGAGGRGGAGGE